MWSPVTDANSEDPAPTSRCKHSATLLHGNLYLLGGKSGNVPLKDFWKFNLAEGKWIQVQASGEKPPCLQEHSAVAYKDQIYVFGGEVGFSSGAETPLWVYSTSRNSWRKVRARRGVQVPRARRGHTALVHKGAMLVYGGYQDLKGSCGDFWAFHFETESWHLLSGPGTGGEVPPARHRHTAVLHDDSMYIYGGMTDLVARGDLWRWDTRTRCWSAVKCGGPRGGPGPRHGHTAAAAHAYMVVLGGEGDLTQEIWRFAFHTETWEKIDTRGDKPNVKSDAVALTVSDLHLTQNNTNILIENNMLHPRPRTSRSGTRCSNKITPCDVPNSQNSATTYIFPNNATTSSSFISRLAALRGTTCHYTVLQADSTESLLSNAATPQRMPKSKSAYNNSAVNSNITRDNVSVPNFSQMDVEKCQNADKNSSAVKNSTITDKNDKNSDKYGLKTAKNDTSVTKNSSAQKFSQNSDFYTSSTQNYGIFDKNIVSFDSSTKNDSVSKNFNRNAVNFDQNPAESFDRNSANFDRNSASFDQRTTNFDRNLINSDRNPASFDRSSTNFDRNPPNFDRNTDNFDRNPASFDRNTASFDRNPANFDRNTANHDRNPPNFDRITASFDRNSASFDRSTASFDRNQANFDRNTANHDRNPPNFDRSTANFDRNPGNFDQSTANYNRNLTNFDQNPASFDKTTANFDRNPPSYDQSSANFDRNPPSYDRSTATFDRNPPNFDRNSANFDRNPASFDRNSANFDRNPFNFDRNSANHDRNSANLDRNAANYDRNSANFDRNIASFDQNPSNCEFDNLTNFDKSTNDFESRVNFFDISTTNSTTGQLVRLEDSDEDDSGVIHVKPADGSTSNKKIVIYENLGVQRDKSYSSHLGRGDSTSDYASLSLDLSHSSSSGFCNPNYIAAATMLGSNSNNETKNSANLDVELKSLNKCRRKVGRAASASRAETRTAANCQTVSSSVANSPPNLYIFLIGGKEPQVTVCKRPVSIWKLQLY